MGQPLERRPPTLRLAQDRGRDLRQPRRILPTNLRISRLHTCTQTANYQVRDLAPCRFLHGPGQRTARLSAGGNSHPAILPWPASQGVPPASPRPLQRPPDPTAPSPTTRPSTARPEPGGSRPPARPCRGANPPVPGRRWGGWGGARDAGPRGRHGEHEGYRPHLTGWGLGSPLVSCDDGPGVPPPPSGGGAPPMPSP
jgi:hypothetical protein